MRVCAHFGVASWFPTGFDICPRPIRRAPPSRGVPRGTPHPRAHRHQSWEHHFQRVVDFLCFPQDLTAPGPAPAPRIPFIAGLLGGLPGKPYAISSCDFPRLFSLGGIYRTVIVFTKENERNTLCVIIDIRLSK